jgi:hypothetical protein
MSDLELLFQSWITIKEQQREIERLRLLLVVATALR